MMTVRQKAILLVAVQQIEEQMKEARKSIEKGATDDVVRAVLRQIAYAALAVFATIDGEAALAMVARRGGG